MFESQREYPAQEGVGEAQRSYINDGTTMLALAASIATLSAIGLVCGIRKAEEVIARHQAARAKKAAGLKASGKNNDEIEKALKPLDIEAGKVASDALNEPE